MKKGFLTDIIATLAIVNTVISLLLEYFKILSLSILISYHYHYYTDFYVLYSGISY